MPASSRGKRGRQDLLVERQVQPLAELVRRLADNACRLEAQAFMQGNGGLVGHIDTADHHMHLALGRDLDQFAEQALAQAHATAFVVHVDRVLDAVLVGRAVAEWAVAGEAQQGALGVFETDHRQAVAALGSEPLDHRGRFARLVVVQSSGVEDGVVEDGENGLGVAFFAAVDEAHGGYSGRSL